MKELEKKLTELKNPLTILVNKLFIIQKPAATKAQLEALLEKELETFDENVNHSDWGEN